MSACTIIACWLIGSRPHFIADTATPARVCVWITQLISGRAVHAAVDHEARLVHAHAERIVEDLAVPVDLHQVRRRDLVEHQAVGIEQEILGARDARREVRVDEVGPLEDRASW